MVGAGVGKVRVGVELGVLVGILVGVGATLKQAESGESIAMDIPAEINSDFTSTALEIRVCRRSSRFIACCPSGSKFQA
jgi:hypothetical protein